MDLGPFGAQLLGLALHAGSIALCGPKHHSQMWSRSLGHGVWHPLLSRFHAKQISFWVAGFLK